MIYHSNLSILSIILLCILIGNIMGAAIVFVKQKNYIADLENELDRKDEVINKHLT
tara:strand:- start:3205 stop:3372 length:168 start_codon:yes stop_codon:yes gene_type:complete